MFKLLNTFRAVYETKNFSKAAEVLFISQPAVSNQIKQLEEELNVELFVRSGRQEMVTTKQAEILYHHLLNLADDWEDILQALKTQSVPKETCKIIASNTFAVYYLPELMKELVRHFPEVSFVLEMDNSEVVLDKIEKHQAHFGFIEKPLITETAIRQEILNDELVHAGDLSSELWLVREESSGVYHYTERYFLENNLSPQKMIIKNNEIIVRCLEKGIGQSILSKKALTPKIHWQSLSSGYQRKFYLIKRDRIDSTQLRKIVHFITTHFQKENG
ncbi:LysR family transcriptional regulator [Enterococcus wangshanyuanii]|uniref:LysR family transcriptional regulator n=1 Tax=Enterococcus wangshanyuanii TaxID=2005703 RepID=A0ABQ1PC23_9ENTE|nr:LysR family transcriptional regulator [Enterococcus wangshanyuanii]GGC94274.1 LysR family transcriptional regulator [Enterococcus wangshanyuanii]